MNSAYIVALQWVGLGLLLLAVICHYWEKRFGFLFGSGKSGIRFKSKSQGRKPAINAHIDLTVQKAHYLLKAYKLKYRKVIAAILQDKVPPAFNMQDLDQFVDWILLKKYVVDHEVSWQKVGKGLSRQPMANAVERLLPRSAATNLSNIRFNIAPDGAMSAVYDTGAPITLPEGITSADLGDSICDIGCIPGTEKFAPDPAPEIARDRETLRQEALKALNNYR